jgi:hypothetical protein
MNFRFKWKHRDGSILEFGPTGWTSDDPQKIDCLLNQPSGSGVAIPPDVRKWLQEECELTDSVVRTFRYHHANRSRMNRNFSVFAFPLLLAFLFLFSDQLSRLSVPRSMLESEKTIDRMALKRATLINSHAVGPFPDPVEIRVSANYQAVDSSIDSAIDKVTRRLRRAQRRLKDRVHPSFNVKNVSRHRPTANLVTQFHSWLVGEFGLAHTTNGWPLKQNLINGRRSKKQLATSRLAVAGLKAHGQN